VSGHPEDVHPAGPDLHHEQDVEPAQRDGVEGEEVGGQQTRGLSAGRFASQCLRAVVPGRVGRRSGSGGWCLRPRGARGRRVLLGGVGGPRRGCPVPGAAPGP
jgi:hypothetical protein